VRAEVDPRRTRPDRSVARFLRPLTNQRIEHDDAGDAMAQAVVAISAVEGLAAHGATAAKRLARVGAR
jgi:sulfopropanediol 3-dehydrogenase